MRRQGLCSRPRGPHPQPQDRPAAPQSVPSPRWVLFREERQDTQMLSPSVVHTPRPRPFLSDAHRPCPPCPQHCTPGRGEGMPTGHRETPPGTDWQKVSVWRCGMRKGGNQPGLCDQVSGSGPCWLPVGVSWRRWLWAPEGAGEPRLRPHQAAPGPRTWLHPAMPSPQVPHLHPKLQTCTPKETNAPLQWAKREPSERVNPRVLRARFPVTCR